MPIYEYRCNECGEKFEKLVRSLSSVGEIQCPRCSSRHVNKVISLCGMRSGSAGESAFSSESSCAPAAG